MPAGSATCTEGCPGLWATPRASLRLRALMHKARRIQAFLVYSLWSAQSYSKCPILLPSSL